MNNKEKTYFILLEQYKICLMYGCASIIKYQIYSSTSIEKLKYFFEFLKGDKNG